MNWTTNPTHNRAINQAIQSAVDANDHAERAREWELAVSQRLHCGDASWNSWNDANNEAKEAEAHAQHCNNNVIKVLRREA